MIDNEFINLILNFLESSKRIRDAASLCDNDPIKREMIKGIIEDFNKSSSRAETLRLLVEQENHQNRDFVIQELKELTLINNRIALDIENKLKPLIWN